MTTYAIGDVHGCLESLLHLLETIHFDPINDCLWFSGDLVNRGPQSLETLRFIRDLGDKACTVLGNHDIALLGVACGALPYDSKRHTFKDILEAPDREALIAWLRQQPLIHQDQTLGFSLIHAGILPCWDLPQALSLAAEVEGHLQKDATMKALLCGIYEEAPNIWDPALSGTTRLRFILNCFTRLRYCTPDGAIALLEGYPQQEPPGYYPWFDIQDPSHRLTKLLFGHWSLLKERCPAPNVFALDTGCVWGGSLSALRLSDAQWFSVNHTGK
jgi:bis(5'-nucleosyl)-tetraphosphatase (symmetrical)